jgi:hypothetical protein
MHAFGAKGRWAQFLLRSAPLLIFGQKFEWISRPLRFPRRPFDGLPFSKLRVFDKGMGDRLGDWRKDAERGEDGLEGIEAWGLWVLA